MIILGLDISTSITGYCLMNTDKPLGHRLIEAKGIIISGEKDPYRKSVCIRDEFKKIASKYRVDLIVVEENLQAFRRGLSSAKTLSTLARFNGIVSFLAQDTFQVPLKMLNVNSARKSIGVKVDKKIDISVKDQVLMWISDYPEFQGFDWPMKTLKSGPRKGKTIHAPQCWDIADAAVICLSAITLEQ